MEVAGDICFRRPRPTQGCRADDDDDDDDDDGYNDTNNGLGTAKEQGLCCVGTRNT